MKLPTTLFFILLFQISATLIAQNKILFDASKGQEAGNADWIIDADVFNLGVGSSGPYIGGSESNPQRYPSPAQSGITATTTEDYWTGALSYWAIDCVKKGYTVETLPWNGQITYGNASNLQDLSNYKVFVVDEPNLIFTGAQKTALLNFVANGGGLFIIADHDVSDRNGDGFDSPHIWNDFFTSNALGVNPFGFTFDYVDFTQTTSNITNLPTDPILHGASGNVTQVKFSGGTTMTLNTTENSSIKGVVYKMGATNTGLVNVMCAYGTYGSGRFVAVGDSSIAEDGTGDVGDILYDGYITDANGNHKKLLLNSTTWLMGPTLSNNQNELEKNLFSIAPNPVKSDYLTISLQNGNYRIFNLMGQTIASGTIENNTLSVGNLANGIYLLEVTLNDKTSTKRFIKE
jgi:hypothetical protein